MPHIMVNYETWVGDPNLPPQPAWNRGGMLSHEARRGEHYTLGHLPNNLRSRQSYRTMSAE